MSSETFDFLGFVIYTWNVDQRRCRVTKPSEWPFTRMKQLIREKSAREHRDITYREIAEETGLAWSTVERYANNRVRRPDLEVVAKLCAFFGVSLSEFVVEDDEASEQTAVAAP